jgi:hypothetical protein
LDFGASARVSFELLFLKEYIGLDYKTRCAPIDYTLSSNVSSTTKSVVNGFGRYLLMPVNPVCVRGFSISLFVGTGTGKVVNANMFTAVEKIKYVSLAQWEDIDNERERTFRSEVPALISGTLRRDVPTPPVGAALPGRFSLGVGPASHAFRGAFAVHNTTQGVKEVLGGVSSLTSGDIIGGAKSLFHGARRTVGGVTTIIGAIQGLIATETESEEARLRAVEAERSLMTEDERRRMDEQSEALRRERLVADMAAERARAEERENERRREGLRSWASQITMATKSSWVKVQKAGRDSRLPRSKNFVVVEQNLFKVYPLAVFVSEKGWTVGGSPAISVDLQHATLEFPTNLADLHANDFKLKANSWFKLSVPDMERSHKFVIQDPRKLIGWITFLHNKISLYRAQRETVDFYTQIDRFTLQSCILHGFKLVDSQDKPPLMQDIPTTGVLEGQSPAEIAAVTVPDPTNLSLGIGVLRTGAAGRSHNEIDTKLENMEQDLMWI